MCRAGEDHYCVAGPRFLGAMRPGAYASHVIVPHPKYLVDAKGVDEAFAATLACCGLTTYSATAKLPALGRRDWVAVIGCGGLGMVCISVLRARGIRNIVACDIDEAKLAAE
ncbi:MAG: alcohol dehydrogenase, partial [Burkholderiales bacterium]|nr:alcohol dehydrogenase [Burkholderiales bacterium]